MNINPLSSSEYVVRDASVGTKWFVRPSVPDLLFVVIAPVMGVAGAIKLTQSDGDLAAHINMGNEILQNFEIPIESLSAYTVAGERLVAHSWLSEVVFSTLYRLGGLPLIAIVTGLLVALTHGLIAQFLRRRGVDARWALIAALLSFVLGATHWLARPHMFTIFGAVLLLLLLERGDRWSLLGYPLLFACWANLHGGWLYGLLLIGMYLLGDIAEMRQGQNGLEWRQRTLVHFAAFMLGGLSTLANPLGINWIEPRHGGESGSY